MGDVHAIRRLHHVQGWSQRRISRELGIARNTVRAVLRGQHDGKYTLSARRGKPVMGAHLETIRAWLKSELESGTWAKQRLTAKRIHVLLEEEHGFSGSESTVRRAVRELRLELGLALREAYVPLEFEPSVDAQVDFFEADVMYRRELIRTSFLLVRACYSTRPYVSRVPAENQEALFEGLTAAFEYYGGVFHNLWFDNMTLAVKRVLARRGREVQKRFEDFRLHYAFEASFCAPGRGSDKGLVENGVKFVRQNALTPVPEVDEWDELATHLERWMAGEDNRTPIGRGSAVGELWAEERALIPLPRVLFDAGRLAERTVSAYSLVTYKTNLYSVPASLVGSEVIVKVYAQRVEFHSRTGKVAEHPRLYGRNQTSFELDHYLELLHWKPRAFDRAAPVRAARRTWPASYDLLLRVLRSRLGDVEGTRSFIHILWQHKYHPADRVQAAIRQALTHAKPSLAAVMAYLDVGRRAELPQAELTPEDLAAVPDVRVDDGDPTVYDELRGGER